MPDLIAQGKELQHRWRRPLPEGQPVVLGRASGVWSVPWDPHISRQHAELTWKSDRLEVVQLSTARNPIYVRGNESARFSLLPGEHFVIGDSTFILADQQIQLSGDSPQPIQQQTFSAEYLRQIRFRNPDYRMEVLSRIPDVIAGATGDEELCLSLVGMLLAGLPRADAAAVVEIAMDGDDVPQGRTRVRMMYWDQRRLTGDDFYASQRLIGEAIRQRQSVLHVWQGDEPAGQAFTARGNFDWAFSTPVLGEASRGWVLYVAGRFNVELPSMPGTSDPSDLREDIKFTELVAAMLSSLRQMQSLNRQHAIASQFLSPVVLSALSSIDDPDQVLAPRETEVSVLFCDLRGFSRHSERHAGDLLELLTRVSQALGVMTHHILEQAGVVGDFQGDAAMGFWGWPLPQDDAVLRTCRAALAIRREFATAAQQTESPLAGFHAGIGVATGKAVAGKIGTADHVKLTVFGPVVNLASRLEGMTKILRAPILLDQTTAQSIRRRVPAELARVRRLAIVRPYGLDTPIEVNELLPPVSEYPLLTDEHLATSEAVLDAFVAGRWSSAYEMLHRLPAEDEVADFLTEFIVKNKRVPPPDWDGVIELSSK